MMADDDDRTKMKKIDLIQQATTRLRRKQLEEQLSDMLTGLKNIHAQSKHMYDQLSDAMTTTQQLTDYDIEQQHEQMDLLENSVKLHRDILQQWFPLMSTSATMNIPQDSSNECDDMNDTKTGTMSRLSSLSMISSLFSRPISRSTSISEFTEIDGGRGLDSDNASSMEQQWNQLYRYQRRLRVKNHRQRHQHRQRINGTNDDRDNVLADVAIASTGPSLPTKNRQHLRKQPTTTLTSICQVPPRSAVPVSPVALSLKPVHPLGSTIPLPSPPLSPMSSSCACQSPSPQEKGYLDDHQDTLSLASYSQYEFSSDNGKSDISDGYCEMDTHHYSSSMAMQYGSSISNNGANDWHQYSEHKALDDTMDILEQMDAMEKEGYDEYFFQDMAFLLDHPDLCSQPLADLAPLLEQQHHHSKAESGDKDRPVTSGWPHGPSSGSTTPYIQHLCSSGWQWYRFVSILSASYLVSLLKGPDDLLMD